MNHNDTLDEFFILKLFVNMIQDHPNIVKIYEGFIFEEKLYIVME